MYILLSRARRNFGDFLILERFVELLKHFRPEAKIEYLDGHQQLDKQADVEYLNSARAIVLYGGPGYGEEMYPAVYPLIEDLNSIKTKIFFGGMGASFYPVNENIEKKFKFNSGTEELLKRVNESTPIVGSRDFITHRILKNSGVDNAVMTGCPAWYSLDSIGKKFDTPANLKTIIFTTPAVMWYFTQAKELLKAIRKEFPDTEIIVSFQRGLKKDEFATDWEIKANNDFAEFSKELGCQIADTSYDTSKIDFYNDADLHIGYRVHGHIWFLSKRKPSLLIAEDSRGLGVIEALKTPGISGFYTDKKLMEYIPRKGLAHRIARTLTSKYLIKKTDAVDSIINMIKKELESGFAGFSGTGELIDNYLETSMKKFIMSLP